MSLSPKVLSVAVMLAFAGTAVAGPSERALGIIESNPKAFKASPSDRFVVRGSANHGRHSTVRIERTHKGLDVFEGDMVMVLDSAGSLKNTTMTLKAPLDVDTRASISRDDAIVAAGAVAGDFSRLPSAKLIISNRGGNPTLAYKVRVETDDTDVTYFVGAAGASAGKILFSTNNHHSANATGTAKTLYSGDVAITTNSLASGGFELRDNTRGGGSTINGASGKTSGKIYTDTDNVWGNNTVSDLATAAVDAQYGVAVTWDYYKNVLGRLGIANDNKGAVNRVHYGRKYVNAYWSDACFCMTYGDGDGVTYGPLVDLDVAGHEMSHGVMSREANLTYSGESGGLNESNSDIIGSMVEFYSNNPKDTPDYLIGEEIYIANVSGSANQKALRYMYNPSLEGPGRSVNCYSPTIGSIDVHYSSGPANHFFFLLAEGTALQTFSGVPHTTTVCQGPSTLVGIGRDAAAKIWYTAVRDYMVAGTNYAGARTATLQAAVALGYASGSPTYNAVAAAWNAVSVQ